MKTADLAVLVNVTSKRYNLKKNYYTPYNLDLKFRIVNRNRSNEVTEVNKQ